MINKFITILIFLAISYAITLQEAFDNASSYEGYDKYLVLESGNVYTGGLGIYEGDIYINCQGSVIDLEEGNGVWVYGDVEYPSSLHIEYCTITNGSYYGLSFGGMAVGNIINCNLINSGNGIKLFEFSNLIMKNCNLINNNNYGVGIYSTTPTLFITYSNAWENGNDYMENCPG